MQVTAYLFFSGKCAEAFNFYQETLGGTLTMMTHGQIPAADQMPTMDKDSIVHARLTLGSTLLMGSDGPPEYYEKPAGFSVSLMVETPEEAEHIFAALSEGGSVGMPITETFWAFRFGMVTDRFDVPWMVNCEKPMG